MAFAVAAAAASPPSTHHGREPLLAQPVRWLRMLCEELGGSFVAGVVLVHGFNQGFLGSFFKVVSDFYWKDVQKVQPSQVQLFVGFYYLPWILKPLWGLLTDVLPISGYKRRPYFLLSGVLGAASALTISMYGKMPVVFANVCLIGVTAGTAIAEVVIDACVARNSIERPELAPDMQSLCGVSAAMGALLGYSTSGVFVHKLGAQGALGLLAVPSAALIPLGLTIYDPRTLHNPITKKKVLERVACAMAGMGKAITCPQIWKPSLFMFLSISLAVSTHEGHFYWYTDSKTGPAFSQEFVGMIYAIGAIASIAGVLIYQKLLKQYPFRLLLLFAQQLYFFSGTLDLSFVLRWNLKLGLPDSAFVVLEECCSRIVSKIRWMPMHVLSAKLCPLGIEGTFFALLMCIDSIGGLISKWGGGLLLHLLRVTRTNFDNLWLAVLVRNVLRLVTLAFIFLVPASEQSESLLPSYLVGKVEREEETVELVGKLYRDDSCEFQ